MNTTVIISGASGGIGYETALYLAKCGYTIAALYNSDEESAQSLLRELQNINKKNNVYKCDIKNSIRVRETVSEIINTNKNIFAVVNNAGISLTKLFTDVSEEEYDNVMDTNVKGSFNLTKAVLPYLIHNKQGKIINISSMWGVTGGSCEVVYSTSKAAIIGMTKALAKEVGLSGIQVNCIAPGVIETKMLNNLNDYDKSVLKEETPLNRLGTPSDIAKTIEFLLSNKSDFITGQVINVDGGMVI